MNQRINLLAKAGATMRSLEDANDCIAQFVAEVEKYRKNSARYEWLRDKFYWDNEGGHGYWQARFSSDYSWDEIDQSIDDVMSKEP